MWDAESHATLRGDRGSPSYRTVGTTVRSAHGRVRQPLREPHWVCTHPNGTVFLLVTHKVGNRQILPNMAQPWTVQGDVILLPPVPQNSGTDTVARGQAATALDVARSAQAAADAANHAAEKARADAQAAAATVNKLGIPSQQDIKDIAWSLSGDRINHEVAQRLGNFKTSQG